MDNIITLVKELSDVKKQIAKLNERKKELEAFFLERGGTDVSDTKYKSTTYADPDSQAAVVYTEAQSLTISGAHWLKDTLGAVFEDIFTEEPAEPVVKPKNKDIERMLIGVYTGSYIKQTPEEIIAQLPCDAKAKAALGKKLKGVTFEKDRENLVKLGGFSPEDASDYAYLYAEAVVWNTFRKIVDMSGANAEELERCINLGVSVDSSTKITVT